jgi:hypothetical protein
VTRFLRGAVVSVVVGVSAAMLLSGPAHAGPENLIVHNCCGVSTFYPNGEYLGVGDWYGDGWGTRAQVQVWHHPSNTWHDHGSPCFDNQTTGGTDGRVICNYSIAEGAQVRVHLWASKNGSTKSHQYSEVGIA